MSDLTRYEKELAEQLNNLSLPNEDLAWEDMKKLLDKDGDKGGTIPPPPNRNNILWGLLLLVFLTGVTWFFARPKTPGNAKSSNQNELAANKDQSIKNATDGGGAEKNNITTSDINKEKFIDSVQLPKKKNIPQNDSLKISKDPSTENSIINPAKDANNKSIRTRSVTPKDLISTIKTRKISSNHSDKDFVSDKSTHANSLPANNRLNSKNRNLRIAKKGKATFSTTNAIAEDDTSVQTKPAQEPILANNNKDFVLSKKETVEPLIDSTIKKDSNTTKPLVNATNKKVDSSVAAKKKDDNKKKKKSYLTAGLAVQQAVRLDCHCVYPTDNNTNTTKFSDYLPSVYVRFYHAKKWFLQAEFKYAAPQFIDEFVYKTKIQNLPLNYITTSYVLNKVYYNQLPVSFNYFVIPNLSVGAGIIYNGFSRESSQVDVRKKLYGEAADSLISSTTIKDKNDSNFVHIAKSNFQGMFEAQYQWRRLSIGARYAFGLGSYVKYTNPYLNLPAEKKNTSLDIFVRYELWKQGK